MNQKLTFLACIMFLLTFVSFSQGPKNHYDNKPYVEGEFLIQLTDEGSIRELLMNAPPNYGLKLVKELSKPMRVWLMSFDYTAISHVALQSWFYQQKNVTVADYNYYIQMRATLPGDPSISQQWHHNNTGQSGGTVDADIDSDLAWDITTGGTTATNDDIVICLIESGNLDHQDLSPNRWFNSAEIENNGIDDDGNGYIDDYNGWNPIQDNDNYGTGGHGTNCLGMMGAKGNNGLNVVGANWDVKLMVVGDYSISTQANAVEAYTYPLVMRQRWNNSNGADGAFVVATSSSWGIDGANPSSYPIWCSFYDTLGHYGIINVGATTNSNLNVDVSGDMPTACSSPYMLGVGRTDKNDNTAGGYGVNTIEFGAPGIDVVTTNGTTGITTTTGTSFSCPLTAGVVGLAYSIPCVDFMNIVKSNPELGADMVLQAMFDGVDVKSQLSTRFVTGGRLNSRNTLDELMAVACSATICVPPSAISTSGITETSAVINFTANTNATATHLYWKETGAATYTPISNAISPVNLAGLTGCTGYEYYLQSDCGGELSSATSVASFTTSECGNCIELPYCSAAATDGADEWIESITFGTFTNTSGNDGGYADFFNLGTISVETFQSYNLSITLGWGGSAYDEYSRIWIDYNQNGTFEVSEIAYNQGSASQTNPTGSITIPGTATLGATKMRVQMAYQGVGQATLPGVCGNFTYGEVEDYCLTIAQGVDPSASLFELQQQGISVYPNPLKSEVNFEITNENFASIEIVDMVGKSIAFKKCVKGVTTFDMSAFDSGSYFYKINGADGKVMFTNKLIKLN